MFQNKFFSHTWFPIVFGILSVILTSQINLHQWSFQWSLWMSNKFYIFYFSFKMGLETLERTHAWGGEMSLPVLPSHWPSKLSIDCETLMSVAKRQSWNWMLTPLVHAWDWVPCFLWSILAEAHSLPPYTDDISCCFSYLTPWKGKLSYQLNEGQLTFTS